MLKHPLWDVQSEMEWWRQSWLPWQRWVLGKKKEKKWVCALFAKNTEGFGFHTFFLRKKHVWSHEHLPMASLVNHTLMKPQPGWIIRVTCSSQRWWLCPQWFFFQVLLQVLQELLLQDLLVFSPPHLNWTTKESRLRRQETWGKMTVQAIQCKSKESENCKKEESPDSTKQEKRSTTKLRCSCVVSFWLPELKKTEDQATKYATHLKTHLNAIWTTTKTTEQEACEKRKLVRKSHFCMHSRNEKNTKTKTKTRTTLQEWEQHHLSSLFHHKS